MDAQPQTPDLNLTEREYKGLCIALSPQAIQRVGTGRYIVASQSEAGTTYRVWRSPSGDYRCGCWDARRGVACKHSIAVMLRERTEARIMAARREGRGEALMSKMLTTSMQADYGLVSAERGMSADLVLLVARLIDGEQTMGRAA
jgi:hypothetical protein